MNGGERKRRLMTKAVLRERCREGIMVSNFQYRPSEEAIKLRRGEEREKASAEPDRSAGHRGGTSLNLHLIVMNATNFSPNKQCIH